MKKMKMFSQLLLTMGLLFTGPLLMAQSAALLAPQDSDDYFGIADVEIHRTGAGGCQFADHSLFVMTWDGDVPGFGWDLDDGDRTGFQELMADDPISHPDVVVNYYDDKPLAFIVYQMDEYIWFEVWEYQIGANQWVEFKEPEWIMEGMHPNVDRCPEGSLAIVWSDLDQTEVWGATGMIDGSLDPEEVVFSTSVSDNCENPDVAINVYDGERYILVVFNNIWYSVGSGRAEIHHFEYDDFYEDPNTNSKIDQLPSGSSNRIGPPRIASPHHDASMNEHACQVVQVNWSTGDYLVRGGNTNYDVYDPYQNAIILNVLNSDLYKSEIDSVTYDPWDFWTFGPVVSFGEDIHVAWAYRAPDDGMNEYVIIYRKLLPHTGEVKQTHPSGHPYDYSYSLVNYTWQCDGHAYHPSIASRYNGDNSTRRFIGWFNEDNGNDPRPDYKITEWGEIYYDVSVEADVGLVYPNPVFDQLYYDLMDEEASKITLHSYDGRKMLSHHVSNESGSIDVSKLPAGMYIVRIKLPDRIIRKKIIKL